MLKFLLVSCLLAPVGVLAQPVNIRVTNDFERDAEEVSIAVSQSNPDHIAIGANIRYLFTSTNRGESWTHQTMSSRYGVWGDPALAFEGDRLYYAHLAGNIFGDSATWLNGLIVQQSTNMGETWIQDDALARTPPKQQDKPTITEAGYWEGLVPRSCMLMTWTQFDHYASHAPTDSSRILFSQALDGIWQEPIRVDDTAGTCLDDDRTDEGAVVTAGRNGDIYVAWMRDNYLYLDHSKASPVQFGKDEIIAVIDSGWDISIPGLPRANAFPTIAADTTIDRIYVVWTDDANSRTDIHIRTFDGSGSSSSIRQINASDGYAQHFYPSLAMDRTTGHLAVLYYASGKNGSDDVDVMLARSHDHGESWTNEKISSHAFTPNPFVFFGDYIQVTADHGLIYPAWMRVDSSALSVWTAVLPDTEVADVGRAETLTDDLRMESSGAPAISFSLHSDAQIMIVSSDALGRDVRTEASGLYGGGRYRIYPATEATNTVRIVRMTVERAGQTNSFVTKYIE